MYLAEALGVKSADEVDPARPLKLGRFELGTEAAAEASRILNGDVQLPELRCESRRIDTPLYWSVVHQTEGSGELFGFPAGYEDALPTALEIALVRAVAAAPVTDQETILGGNVTVALGSQLVLGKFCELISVVEQPVAGSSLLFNSSTQAIISADTETILNSTCLSCFSNSFRTSPLKFRFLELYRIIEARFLADVKAKLLASFDTDPSEALQEAVDALKSEMNQIKGLAENQKDEFEACWSVLDPLQNTNRFAAALFRKAKKRGLKGHKWETGAALIYQVRCAIVHAGQKDLIFESFPDGDDVISALIEPIERIALLLMGIDVT